MAERQQQQRQQQQQQQRHPQVSTAEAQRRASTFMAALLAAESFDQHTLKSLQLLQCSPGHVCCSLQVAPELQNRYGTLHGGAIATLVDVVGSLALITQSDRSGVSLAINTLYLNPMPGGEVVQVDASVIKLGRDVATVEVRLRQGGSSGQLVATGTHTKKLVSNSDMSALFEAPLQSGPQQQLTGQQQLGQQQHQQSVPKQVTPPRSRL